MTRVRQPETIAEWERVIRVEFSRHRLTEVLLAISSSTTDEPNFFRAAMAMWAIRACRRDPPTPTTAAISVRRFSDLMLLVRGFQLCDPIEDEVEPSALCTFLRIVASQWVFEPDLREFGRAWLLWHVLPDRVKNRRKVTFDFIEAFRAVNGMSPSPFLRLLYTTWAGSANSNNIGRGYFSIARAQRIKLPEDQEVKAFLNHVAGTQNSLNKLATKHQCEDRRYAPYDLNPLLLKPIIRPWPKARDMDRDAMIVPVPDLIPYRATKGTYYALYNAYQEKFSQYFGYLFEEYVGVVLTAFIGDQTIVAEGELRQICKSDAKVVDWLVRVGGTAIIIECKATRLNRLAVTNGVEQDVYDALAQVRKGITQLRAMSLHLQSSNGGSIFPNGVTEIIPVLVTWEDLPLVNSTLMQQLVGDSAGLVVLSVSKLEYLQMLSTKGVGIVDALKTLLTLGPIQGSEVLMSQTEAKNGDSFLASWLEELLEAMGISEMHNRGTE